MANPSPEPTQDSPPARWSQLHPGQAALAYAIAYLGVGGLGNWLAGKTTAVALLLALVVAVSLLSLVFALLLVFALCRVTMRPGAEATAMLAMVAVFAIARPLVVLMITAWLGIPQVGERIAGFMLTIPGSAQIGNTALILWAIFLGRLVSRVLREGNMLLPVAVVASIGDVITVFHGPVAKVVEKAPVVVEAFSATVPVSLPQGVAVPVLTAVGLGDFLFLALFLAVALRYSMNAVQALWGAFAAMLVAPFAFLLWPDAPGMPGLPFISVGVVAANWRQFKYSPSERRALAIAGVVVAAVTVAVWLAVRRHG